ncbi:MAG: hypothetical protein QM709_11570 [Spongiibacteraceae bacterium]
MWMKFLILSKGFLASGRSVVAAAIVGMLLAVPAINTGFVADDFFHWEVLSQRIDNSHPGSIRGMFSFADGNPARTREFMKEGVFPWWSSETVRLSFWRPLSEITHWLDYVLWPKSIPLMHVQSIFWYGAVLVALGFWLRSIDANKSRANLATWLYAISAAHGTVVGWIANRNALVAAFFALLSLIAFHRARQCTTSSRAAMIYVLSYAMFVLSLFGGEAAVATGAYLFAYILLLDKRSSFASRFALLIPFALIVLVWKYFYSALGYGSHEAGLYIDPAVEPIRFLYNAALRVPALLLAQIFGAPSIIYTFLPKFSLQIIYSLIAFSLIVVFALAARSLGLWRDITVRFYALGMLLATLPVCAAGPDDRLLTFAGFGGCGLLASFLLAFVAQFKTQRGIRGVGLKGLAGYLVLIHFVIAPVALAWNVNAMFRAMGPFIEYPAIAFPESKLNRDTRLMLINPPLPSCVAYIPFVREYHGLVGVRSAFAMAPGSRAMTFEVIDEHTIQITMPAGFLSPLDNFFRDPRLGFTADEKIDLDYVQVVVIDVMPDGQPKTVQFRFRDSLRASNLQFYYWQKDSYREFTLPAVGGRVEIDAFDFRHPERETLRSI